MSSLEDYNKNNSDQQVLIVSSKRKSIYTKGIGKELDKIRNFKIKFTFLISLSLTLFAIIFLSYIVWGSSIFQPILFASERESPHFSIFNL